MDYRYNESMVQDALAVVGQGMARDYGIRVQWHDGRRVSANVEQRIVRIPRLSAASPMTAGKTVDIGTALMLTRSNVAHEFGHCGKTKLPKGQTPQGALFSILNALEDVRMERAVAEDYPGYANIFAEALRWSNREIANGFLDGKLTNGALWEAMCACIFQSQGVRPAWTLRPQAQRYFDVAYGEFVKVLVAKNTADCLVLAQRIFDLLKQEAQQPEPEPQEQEPQDGEPQEGDGDGEPQDGKGKKQTKQTKKQAAKKNQQACEDEETGEGDEDDGGDNAPQNDDDAELAGDKDEDGDGEGDEKDGKPGKSKKADAGDEDAGAEGDDEGKGKSGKPGEDEDGDEAGADGEGDEDGADGEETDADGKPGKGQDGEEAEGDADGEAEGDGADGEGDKDGADGKDGEGEGEEGDKDSDKTGHNKGGSDKKSDKQDASGDKDAKDDAKGNGLTPDEEAALEKRLDEEAAGKSLQEQANDAIEDILGDVAARGDVYTSRRDTDEHRVPGNGSTEQKQFTDRFDKMQQEVAAMSLALEQALRAMTRCRKDAHLRRGRIDGDRLVEIAKGLSREVFYRTRQGRELDTAVSLVIDQSASMSVYARVRDLTILLGECMYRLGIPFEIVGTTTKYSAGDGPGLDGFSRTNPLVYDHYKDFAEQWPMVRARLMHMGVFNHNIDGEAVEYAAARIATRHEARKIVFSLCDGEPCGGQGNDEVLAENIKRVAKAVRATGIEVYGVGIGTRNPAMFYGKQFFIGLGKDDGLGQEFVRVFATILTHGEVRV